MRKRNEGCFFPFMKHIDHLPPGERQHYIRCDCGHYYDMRDLSAVFRHLHEKDLPEPQWSYAVRIGMPVAHGRNGRKQHLN